MIGWARVALAVWVAAAALFVGALLLGMGQPWSTPDTVLWRVALFGFACVGALIGLRRPGNRVGAVFLGSSFILLLQAFSFSYAARALLGGAELPGAVASAWLSAWVSAPGVVVLLVFLPLLFPDGRLPSLRWRPAVWAASGLAVVASVALAINPGPLPEFPVANPFGVPAAAGFSGFILENGFAFLAALGLLAAASLVQRFRRSRGVERQQIKWVSFSFLLVTLQTFVVVVVLEGVLGLAQNPAVDAVGLVVLLTVPASAAIAILRYRLYDIDRIISRTLAYGLVTAALLGVYGGTVLFLGPLLGRGSDLAVAGSTLAAAAAFQPLRRRVQAIVDRRFNRARYDAQRTVEAFASRLRDQVDLTELRDELVAAATVTMQPSRAAVWLRPSAGGGQ